MLIGFAARGDLSDHRPENDPRFLRRIATARKSLEAGYRTRLEELDLDQ